MMVYPWITNLYWCGAVGINPNGLLGPVADGGAVER
jgi:hypothetical protein